MLIKLGFWTPVLFFLTLKSGFPETSSQLTPSSTGESANFQSLSAGRDTFGPGSAEQAAVLVRATAKSVSWHRYRSQAAEALIFSLPQPAGRYGGDRHAAAYRPFRWEPLTCR